MKTVVIKSGATILRIEAESVKFAIESFEHEHKGKPYEVLSVENYIRDYGN
jgi:hypothetical protein